MTASERSGDMLIKKVMIVRERHVDDGNDNACACLYVMQPEQPIPPEDINDFTFAATTTLQRRA